MDRNSLTILAVLALSVSNLFVGISSQNKLLILASAGISAALALLYIARDVLRSRFEIGGKSITTTTDPRNSTHRSPFPLWVFVVILFILLPALMWAVQLLTQ